MSRLPSCSTLRLFAADAITDLAAGNSLLEKLLPHRNAHERHRELRMTPLAAWHSATKENRSALRPAPRCPWWPYVWSLRILVGPDGRVPIAPQRLRLQAPPRTCLVHWQHPNGDISLLRHHSDHATKPSFLLHLPA